MRAHAQFVGGVEAIALVHAETVPNRESGLLCRIFDPSIKKCKYQNIEVESWRDGHWCLQSDKYNYSYPWMCSART